MRKMKDSGYSWIREIPQNWNIRKLKNISNIYVGNSIKDEEKKNYEDSENAIPYIATREIDVDTSKVNYNNGMYTKVDDIIFKKAKRGSTLMCIEGGSAGKKIAYLEQDVSFVNKLCCFEANEINKKYLYYYLKSPAFRIKFDSHISGLIGGVSQNQLKEFPICIPNNIEQQKIADFLDKKVSKIDNIIENTKEIVEDYKKYKQSIITEVVTKGIRDYKKFKDSDNIHIGQIPENWKMKKIKYIFSIKKTIAGKEGYDILAITQKGIKKKDLSNNDGQLANDYSNYQLVDKGDFAMNHMDLLTGWVDISKYNGVTSPDYRVFNFIDKNKYFSEYYLYLMQMCYTNKIFYGLGQGVSNLGRWRLQTDKFLNFTVPVPELKEQKEIAEYLNNKCKIIDEMISNKEDLIGELENYKKSLIYEYVTGKKEVKSNKILNKNNSKGIKINCKDNIFAQAILLCRIIDKLSKYNLGRVKVEKTLYLIEKDIGFEFDNNYIREAAGPLSVALYKSESIAKKNKWLNITKKPNYVQYEMLPKFNDYKKYYENYYSGYDDKIEKIIDIIKDCSTDKAEMVATLYASWNDFIIKKEKVSDLEIVKDVRENWNDTKKRFDEKKWLVVLEKMKQIGLTPKGNGNLTMVKEQ